jgi:hypothetical protein
LAGTFIGEGSSCNNTFVGRRRLESAGGWPRLVRSISDANIVNLPHSKERSICDQCGGSDGIDYYFEIAMKNMYRFYYYCNPKDASGCYEAKTVLNFATLLEKEFNFTYTK